MSSSALHRVSYRTLALRSLDQLPPFSPILNRLLASLADEEVSFAEIAALIERDTVLSANVLRLVNSAMYGRRGTVSSVRAAVSILGLAKLRNTVLGLSVSRIWNRLKTPKSWDMARFNQHSAAVAVLSDLLVQKLEADYPEGAFAAGLLHDLGRLMIATTLPEEFELIEAEYAAGEQGIEEIEFRIIEVTHSELSAAALSKWNLPAPIRNAVLYHHNPGLDPEKTSLCKLSSIVQAANRLANATGNAASLSAGRRTVDMDDTLSRLGLQGSRQELTTSFETEFSAFRASFGA